MIIDFHAHTFPSKISGRVIENLSRTGHIRYFTDASCEALAESMHRAGIACAVNLPVMTRADQVVKVNDDLLRKQETMYRSGILTFGGLHPAFEDYRAELRRLKEHGIRGVKLHPAFQGMDVSDIAFKRLIGAISDEGLICLLHCGKDAGFQDHDYASVPQLLELIRDVQPEKLVLAHMGGWQNWDDVERDLAGAPVWMDTAYCFGAVSYREGEEELLPYRENLSRERFTKLVRQHGTDRVLFATDCPWSDQKAYVDFMDSTDLHAEEKEKIFAANAMKLLDIGE